MIDRETLIKVCNLLGWDPHDVAEIRIAPREVTATLYERDERGMKVLNSTATGALKYEETVKVNV